MSEDDINFVITEMRVQISYLEKILELRQEAKNLEQSLKSVDDVLSPLRKATIPVEGIIKR
jgi:hypothetical protein